MRTVVWMPQEVRQTCIDEASRTFPLETGGTFMGWWAGPTPAVITAVIGPGPKALHERRHFQPDQDWQLEQIACYYEASGRRETNLGDWHSHPRRTERSLSWTDRRALRSIIGTPSARCPAPLMAVLWGHPDDWQTAMWQAQLQPRRLLWDQLVVNEARLRSLDSPTGLADSSTCLSSTK